MEFEKQPMKSFPCSHKTRWQHICAELKSRRAKAFVITLLPYREQVQFYLCSGCKHDKDEVLKLTRCCLGEQSGSADALEVDPKGVVQKVRNLL